MDRGTENMIMSLITRLKTEMGILLIAHRINMVKNLSDYIYVIECGSIISFCKIRKGLSIIKVINKAYIKEKANDHKESD
jgi:ABC-type branched-subunit amino acid transport system ATPase component